MRKIMTLLAAVAAVTATPLPAFAHHNTSHSLGSRAGHQSMSAPPCAAHEAAGVVAAISGNEITIQHEPIASLNWPAMTMTFEAQSPGLLEGLAVGDHVRFRFQEPGSAHLIDQVVKQ